MVKNVAIKSIIFPCPDRPDIRNKRNSTYDLNAPPVIGLVPQNFTNGDGTYDDFEQRNMFPIHNSPPPNSSNPFTCSSFGFYFNKEMLREQQAREEEQDGLLYSMYEH